MRFLVTGTAGFIGSHVSEQLLEQGHQVVGVDSLNDAYDVRLKTRRLGALRPRPRFTFHQADVSRPEDVRALFAEGPFDGVLNLAARAGVRQSLLDPRTYLRTNVEGALNVLDACRAHDVKTVVLASTSSLYGANPERPFRETASTDRPLSPYAASKKAAESLTASYAHLYGLNTPILRYFTVYGPAGRPDMSVFRFTRWIAEGEPLQVHGDGLQSRDFTFVEDIARGTIAALGVRGFEIINLGGDKPASMLDVVSILERKLGRTARIERRERHPADVTATWADITKARKLLGWEPRVSLDEGLGRCVEWYVKNREWVKDIDMGTI